MLDNNLLDNIVFPLRSVAVLVLLAVTPSSVAAQRTNSRERAMARALFEEGLELGEQEQWEEAADRFARAYELHESPSIAVNLASVLIPLGQLVEASELLRSVLDDRSIHAGVRELAETLLEDEVEPTIAELTIHVVGDDEGVEVRRDGDRIPSAGWGVALPADPGDAVVTAELDGEVVALEEIVIEEGGSAEVTLNLDGVPTAREVAEDDTRRRRRRRRRSDSIEDGGSSVVEQWWFWTGLAVVAAAVTVVVFVTLSSEEIAAPVQGSTDPPFLEGEVLP